MPTLPTLEPEYVLEFLAGLTMLALAAALVHLDFRNRTNRAFALFLVLRGVLNIALSLAESAEPVYLDRAPDGYWWRVTAHFGIAMPFAALYFARTYHEAYAGARHRPWIGWALLAGAVTAEGLHALGETIGGLAFGGALAGLMASTFYLAYGFLALQFIAHYAARPADPRRASSLLLGLAFGLLPMFTGPQQLANIVGTALAAAGTSVPSVLNDPLLTAEPTYAVATALFAASAIPVVAGWARLGRTGTDGARRASRLLALAALSALAAVGASLVLPAAAGTVVFRVVDAGWTLAFPLIAAYALVRHQLFDIDVKVRWTVKQSTVAAAFIAVFFIVSELAAQVLSDKVGAVLGIVAAGGLVFAIAPLQRAADRIAKAAVPVTVPAAPAGNGGAERAFAAAVEMALGDGIITRAEERSLARMARELSIDAERALELREQAEARREAT